MAHCGSLRLRSLAEPLGMALVAEDGKIIATVVHNPSKAVHAERVLGRSMTYASISDRLMAPTV